MFYVNNNPILATEIEVLQALKNQLLINGLELFADMKIGTTNIQVTCPIHNNGQERKPSCGISTVNKKDTPAGTVHCFTCGYTATLEQMVSNVFGFDDDGSYGKKWLIKNFLTVSIESRQTINLQFGRSTSKPQQRIDYVSETVLATYRYYHDYMYKRGLTDDVIELFDIGYDDCFQLKNKEGVVTSTMRCLTFPVRDIVGNTVFVARRSVDYKFFHYPLDVEKPVYGLYELPDHTTTVIVTESSLNALSCYVHGSPAVSLLGTGTEYQYKQLLSIPGVRKFIIALDPDEAGRKATLRFKKYMSKYRLVTEYIGYPDGKDLNDLSAEEFAQLEEIF